MVVSSLNGATLEREPGEDFCDFLLDFLEEVSDADCSMGELFLEPPLPCEPLPLPMELPEPAEPFRDGGVPVRLESILVAGMFSKACRCGEDGTELLGDVTMLLLAVLLVLEPTEELPPAPRELKLGVCDEYGLEAGLNILKISLIW